MTQVTWYLDEQILERLVYHGRSLPDVVRNHGGRVELVVRDDVGGYSHRTPDADECTVLFGSHSFVKALTPGGHFQPGSLGVNERTQATQYMSNLPLDWFLNQDGIFMTWSMFKQYRGIQQICDHWPDGLFIRPNSGFKTFAGQRITAKDFDDHVSTLDQTSGVVGETLILVAQLSEIQGEFRFVIADGKVVAGSEYRWDGKLDIRRDWPPECEDLARQVAEHEWQVDIAYTCDVALTPDGPRVVELNGFSCAGMYACDLDKVVPAISAAALKEFSGDDL